LHTILGRWNYGLFRRLHMIIVWVGNLGFPLQKETYGFHFTGFLGFHLAWNLGFPTDLVVTRARFRGETSHILWMFSRTTMNWGVGGFKAWGAKLGYMHFHHKPKRRKFSMQDTRWIWINKFFIYGEIWGSLDVWRTKGWLHPICLMAQVRRLMIWWRVEGKTWVLQKTNESTKVWEVHLGESVQLS
jgi:hypothetical protein